MNIYVGNLPFDFSDEELREAFADHGEVSSAQVIRDKMSGQSRGFGFVEMADRAEAEAAIEAVNGRDFKGRSLRVNEARPREDRPHSDRPRSFGGDRGGRPQRSGGGGRRF